MSDVDATTERRIRFGQTARIVVWVILLGGLAAFTFANTQDVAVDWIVDETITALWLVIALSAIAGFVVGYVTSSRRR